MVFTIFKKNNTKKILINFINNKFINKKILINFFCLLGKWQWADVWSEGAAVRKASAGGRAKCAGNGLCFFDKGFSFYIQ